MEGAILVLLTAFGKKAVDFVRYLRAFLASTDAKEKKTALNGILTQLIAWLALVLAVVFAAHTAFADLINVGGISLGNVNLSTQIFAGVLLGSSASLSKDIISAFDNTGSTKIPSVVPDSTDEDDAIDVNIQTDAEETTDETTESDTGETDNPDNRAEQ